MLRTPSNESFQPKIISLHTNVWQPLSNFACILIFSAHIETKGIDHGAVGAGCELVVVGLDSEAVLIIFVDKPVLAHVFLCPFVFLQPLDDLVFVSLEHSRVRKNYHPMDTVQNFVAHPKCQIYFL